MIIIFGRRMYGKTEQFAGSYIASQFAHIWFLPLIPTGSYLVIGQGEAGKELTVPIGLHWKSVLRTYMLTGCVFSTLVLLGLLGETQGVLSTAGYLSAGFLLCASLAMAWASMTLFAKASPRERAERVLYSDLAGGFVDVALLGPANDALHARLTTNLTAHAKMAAAQGKQGAADGWRTLALHPSCTDVAFLKGAFTLCRIEWSRARGNDRAQLAADHAALFDKLAQLSPEILQSERYEQPK